MLGLKWKHVNLDAGTIKIEQRVWHQDIDRPKSENSKRILGIGDLLDRYRAKAAGVVLERINTPTSAKGPSYLGPPESLRGTR